MQTISSTTLRFQETWCRNATLASLRISNGSHQCILPLATIRIEQEGWRILDVGGGIHTSILAIARHEIDAYCPVEADEHMSFIGNNVTKRLKTQYKAQLAPDFLRPTLPQDIELITERMVIDMILIHLLSANWRRTSQQ